jgi:hypothetical protein
MKPHQRASWISNGLSFRRAVGLERRFAPVNAFIQSSAGKAQTNRGI